MMGNLKWWRIATHRHVPVGQSGHPGPSAACRVEEDQSQDREIVFLIMTELAPTNLVVLETRMRPCLVMKSRVQCGPIGATGQNAVPRAEVDNS